MTARPKDPTMRGRAFFIVARWLGATFVAAAVASGACAQDTQPADAFAGAMESILAGKGDTIPADKLKGLSFDEQLRLSNAITLRGEVEGFLKSLDDSEAAVRQGADKDLAAQLSAGGAREPVIVGAVKDLMAFSDAYNATIDGWASGDKQPASARAFWQEYRVTVEFIKKLKRLGHAGDLDYVAVHWYPWAVGAGVEGKPIPLDGLGLSEERWKGGDPHLTMYAFFSFYRKNGLENPAALDAWLKDQTGYDAKGGLWQMALDCGKTHVMRRWTRADYYAYVYIDRAAVPAFAPGSLCARIAAIACPNCDGKAAAELAGPYRDKVDLFRAIASEIMAAASEKRDTRPYWVLYAFVCRGYPCISAFKLSSDGRGGCQFLEGYEGDKPTKGLFGDKSVMRECSQLLACEALKGSKPDLAESVLSPVMLLPVKISSSSAGGSQGPFMDPKVGFEGFLVYAQKIYEGKGRSQ